jgi:ADP-ribose pyrophosphatase YjhB (NUDIX family)
MQLSAIGILRDRDGVVMVESRDRDRAEPFWALPGGMLEAGEGIEEALGREVAEETGLTLFGPAAVVAVIWLCTQDGSPDWVTFVCEPRRWSGELRPADPDGVTIRAALVPPSDAIERLAGLRWGMSDAIVHRLDGGRPGGIWTYRWNGAGPWDGNGPATLVAAPGHDAADNVPLHRR